MKTFRLLALSALVTVASATAIFYASCSKDECKNTVCKNGGTCSGGTCVCPIGFTGSTCSTRSFVGRWAGNDACNPDSIAGAVVINLATATDTTKMTISNIAGSTASIQGTITSPTVITYNNLVLNRTIGGVTAADTLDGNITLTNNATFTHTYTERRGTIKYTCTGTYSKM